MSDFEDPTALARCIKSDCDSYRAGGTPFCAEHLREQEQKSAGIVEPDVEARVAQVRTEDDDHPGMVKVYDKETGEPSWIPAAPRLVPPPETYVLMDPDINGAWITESFEGVRVTPPPLPDPAEVEPHWDGSQWVLREKRKGPDLKAVESLVRELMHELGIKEEGGDRI